MQGNALMPSQQIATREGGSAVANKGFLLGICIMSGTLECAAADRRPDGGSGRAAGALAPQLGGPAGTSARPLPCSDDVRFLGAWTPAHTHPLGLGLYSVDAEATKREMGRPAGRAGDRLVGWPCQAAERSGSLDGQHTRGVHSSTKCRMDNKWDARADGPPTTSRTGHQTKAPRAAVVASPKTQDGNAKKKGKSGVLTSPHVALLVFGALEASATVWARV